MKILLAIFLSAPLLVFACPDLSGRYLECLPTTGHSTGSRDMIVSQSHERGITTYFASAINSQSNERETATYKADGIKTEDVIIDPDNGKRTHLTTLISCENDKLIIDISFSSDEVKFGFSKVSVYKEGKRLIIESHSGDETQEGSDREICE